MRRKTDALVQRALAHAAAGDPQSAIADLTRVLRREPTQPAASIKIAEIEMVLDHYPVAMEHLERMLRINPDNVPALGLLAAGCCDCGLPERAREYAARALRADPADSHAAVVLARAYRLLHCLSDAEQALAAALQVSSGDAYAEGQVHAERAALLEMRGDFDRALDDFRRATRLAPGLDVARQGYATALLREGRFDEGWREFDRGRERRRIRAQLPAVPAEFLWDGTADLAGQQIVLVDELGFGDAIQFLRYLPRIRALGARIVHVTMPHLVPLLSVAAPYAECVSALTPSTRFDWLAFTSSLPGLFRTQPDTIPAEVPYL
ncbi:MAG TPA: tetratricopeptide repeat protein, partial [Acetobacteraceae bacterium]|nr:tetratricopeptide repeat protein [Acetobacteraceae bacterium]